jgi:hypothetical protein
LQRISIRKTQDRLGSHRFTVWLRANIF